MTAAPAGPPPEPAGPAPLALVSDCPQCQARVVTVRSREGKPVRLDALPEGKAVVDPDGRWWLVKVAGQWRVQQLTRGEDEPTSGGGRRHREHECESAAWDALGEHFDTWPEWASVPYRPPTARGGPCAGRCGRMVEARYGPGADPMCGSCRGALEVWRRFPGPVRPLLVFPVAPDGRAVTVVTGRHRRPGWGRGLDGPECPERRELVQHPEVGSRTAMCMCCGRSTSRRDSGDGLAWCGGDLPTPPG